MVSLQCALNVEKTLAGSFIRSGFRPAAAGLTEARQSQPLVRVTVSKSPVSVTAI